ncbi:hypothetical protein N3Z11_16440 [Rheinheimera sp. 4Y26]|nr:hypothetical protein [Rheinheimera sp. 4Y26]
MMKIVQGLVVVSVLCMTAGCANNYTQEQVNKKHAAYYASVDKALKQDENLAKKELVVCFREKPVGTLIPQTVCRTPELMELEREKTKARITRTQLKSFTDNQ